MNPFDAAEGALRARYADVDWATTPLGPVDTWSPTLRSSVQLALNTRFPVTLMWGPQYVMVYNDAYAEMIADKHPAALGAPTAEVFPEAWDVIGPMLDGVRGGTGATWVEDLPLPLVRHGALTEAYFTFSYSPVENGDGEVEGCIDIAAETTDTVVSRRRLELLTRLQAAVADAHHVDDLEKVALPLLRDAGDFTRVDLVSAQDVDDAAARTHHVTLPVAPPTVPPVLVATLAPLTRCDEETTRFLGLVASTLARAHDRVAVREAEADLSDALQRSLLSAAGELPGLDVAVRYQPAGRHVHVGGDWFDAFALADGGSVVVVGDVMGHDRTAAAAMGQIRGLLRGIAHSVDPAPGDLLRGVDRAADSLAVGAIASAVAVRVLPAVPARAGRSVQWSSAGHPQPLVRHPDGRVEVLQATPELLLGVVPDAPRTSSSLELAPGDLLLLYTDGLVERRDRSVDDTLADLADRFAAADVTDLERLCDALLAGRPQTADDDVALAVLRVRAAPTPAPTR